MGVNPTEKFHQVRWGGWKLCAVARDHVILDSEKHVSVAQQPSWLTSAE